MADPYAFDPWEDQEPGASLNHHPIPDPWPALDATASIAAEFDPWEDHEPRASAGFDPWEDQEPKASSNDNPIPPLLPSSNGEASNRAEFDPWDDPDHQAAMPEPGNAPPVDPHVAEQSDEGYGPLTTDYEEFSGSDDSESTAASDGEPLHPAVALAPDPADQDEQIRVFVDKHLRDGLKGPAILQRLATELGVSWSIATLGRRRRQWSLRRSDLPDNLPPAPPSPEIRASLLSSHKKGLVVREMQAALVVEHGIHLDIHTIKQHLQRLHLRQRQNDLASGKVTRPQVSEAIEHARLFLKENDWDISKLWRCLRTTYDMRVPKQLVYDILAEQDPQGLQDHLGHRCERRTFRSNGPNHIWVAGGHDELQSFGIHIYGFIDAWSRRVLGLYVHVTNKDPAHVGVWFLRLAMEHGGIPQLITTDHGTETITMGALQMYLSYTHRRLTVQQAEKTMHWSTSTHNQKLECLWSQLMRFHNREVIDDIYTALESGIYDSQEPVQRLLFLHLWIPLLQTSLDRWTAEYNEYRRRRDKRIALPTGCSAEFAYTVPEYFNATNQIFPIPQQELLNVTHECYPDLDGMFSHTPGWFSEAANKVMSDLGLTFDDLTLGNVWNVFRSMLPHLEAIFPDISLLFQPEETSYS